MISLIRKPVYSYADTRNIFLYQEKSLDDNPRLVITFNLSYKNTSYVLLFVSIHTWHGCVCFPRCSFKCEDIIRPSRITPNNIELNTNHMLKFYETLTSKIDVLSCFRVMKESSRHISKSSIFLQSSLE